MNVLTTGACALAVFACLTQSVNADPNPDSHAPISVMGDHTHRKGEWMFSYRYRRMHMQGNRDGTSDLSPDDISRLPNRFASTPGMPSVLRVVPLRMDMEMHMLGAMYAPTDRVTLMAMLQHMSLEMDHVTFAGPSGANALGRFTTRSEGFGDSTLAALIRFATHTDRDWHATLGLSIPTGDIERRDQILTPMNTRVTPRLPYPMQLGSGTLDLILGLTHRRSLGKFGLGAQWQSTFRTGDNAEQYRLGDNHQLQAWGSYRINGRTSISLRVNAFDQSRIRGLDPLIMAPVQTADPHRQGGRHIDAGLGLNLVLPGNRHRVALEWHQPLWQDLNGPQLERDWGLSLGWQYAP